MAGRDLVTGGDAVVLFVERDGWSLAGLVDVACAANAAEEASGGRVGGGDGLGDGWLLGGGGAGDVAVTTASRTDVGVGGGSWFGDGVVGHFDVFVCVCVCMCISVQVYVCVDVKDIV